MHEQNILSANKDLAQATKALILVHGRGANAQDILTLAPMLNVQEFAWLAPQAATHSWYPNSFLAPAAQNEPWLSSALSVLGKVVDDVVAAGIGKERIYFLGFSQGACLTLEFVTRNAARWGGVAAFTGGLIGDKIDLANYKGDFGGTPIFLGSSNPDPHVPVERVYATSNILRDMGANLTEKIYTGMGHTINQDEIDNANKIVFK